MSKFLHHFLGISVKLFFFFLFKLFFLGPLFIIKSIILIHTSTKLLFLFEIVYLVINISQSCHYISLSYNFRYNIILKKSCQILILLFKDHLVFINIECKMFICVITSCYDCRFELGLPLINLDSFVKIRFNQNMTSGVGDKFHQLIDAETLHSNKN